MTGTIINVVTVLLGGTLGTFLGARLPEALCPRGECGSLSEWVQGAGWGTLVADHPNEAHQVLADLNLPLYLTTNADPFMVEALRGRGKEAVREVCRWNEELEGLLPSRFEEDAGYELSADAPLVYHLLGSDEEPGSLVLMICSLRPRWRKASTGSSTISAQNRVQRPH